MIQRSEKGQILVILTVGIVALLGFTALAVDGGMLYSDRRHDQNAADNASITGARAAGNELYEKNISIEAFDCSDAEVINAKSLANTAAQGMAADYDIPVFTTASAYNAADEGVYVECSSTAATDGKYMLVKVKLTSDTQSFLSQIIYRGNLVNQVEAVTRVEPGVNNPAGPAADGNGIVGLADNCDDAGIDYAADLSGNVNIQVLTGGIHSNSGLAKDGASGCIATQTGSNYRCVSGEPKKTDPFHVGPDCSSSTTQADPEHTDTLVTLTVPPPDCDALEVKTASYNMEPGRYNGISLTSSGSTLIMAPGLYCFTGGVKITGGTVQVLDTSPYTSDDGVTIYFDGTSFEFEGNGSINLRAPTQTATNSGLAIPGMLLYTSETYTGEVKITGTSDSILRGTVFVPSGTLNIGGTSGTTGWEAQWIAKYVRFHGNPNFVLNYDGGDLYWDEGHTTPSLLDVYQ